MYRSALRLRKTGLLDRVVPDSPPRPEPTSMSPTSGPMAGGGTATISGSAFLNPPGFYAVTVVTFNDVPATNVAVLDDDTLTCTVPASEVGANVPVRLFGPGGDRAVPGGYTYEEPVPQPFNLPSKTVSLAASAYTINPATDYSITVSAIGNNLLLPPTPANGDRYEVVSGGAFVVTIDGNGHNIDGTATYTQGANREATSLKYNAQVPEWEVV